MKVKDLMSGKLFTLTPEDNVDKVFVLFYSEHIRHLPIVEKGRLAGILSDRDLKKVLGMKTRQSDSDGGATVTIAPRKIKTLMQRNVTTIGPEQRAADAAAIMAKHKIGALPVVHKDKLVGIITSTDILRAFAKLCNDLDHVNPPEGGRAPGQRKKPAETKAPC